MPQQEPEITYKTLTQTTNSHQILKCENTPFICLGFHVFNNSTPTLRTAKTHRTNFWEYKKCTFVYHAI